MKPTSLLALLVAIVVVPTTPTTALADDKADCLDAVSKGQRFRDAHKLVEARERFRVCAAVRCPAVIQTDCANWLDDVEQALPSVVLTAKNQAGRNLRYVKVSVDGQPLVSQLDGQAVPMNVGPHTFYFEEVVGSERFVREVEVVVREGEKNQLVSVTVLPAPVPEPAPVHKVVTRVEPLRAERRAEANAEVVDELGFEQSIVLTAKNPEGVNLQNVKVSMDGLPLVKKLDGKPVPLSAGSHHLYFEGADGAGLALQVVVRQGQNNQPVAVVLRPPTPTAVTGSSETVGTSKPPTAVTGSSETVGASKPPTAVTGSSETVNASIPWKTVDWILGAAGVAGLGVGAFTGTIAIIDKNAADCSNNVCAGTVSGIKTAALISDVGWITGVVLLGAALVDVAVEGSHQSNASVGLAPLVTTSGGEVLMRGIW